MEREDKIGTGIFLGLGTNEGDRVENLKMALTLINDEVGDITALSGVYETDPWGFESSSRFLNMVANVTTRLAPAALLKKTQEIEKNLGRVRSQVRFSSRSMDVDILLFGNRVINQRELTVPHPLIPERRFVLVPLCDLIPGGIHPVLKQTFSELLMQCRDTGNVSRTEISLELPGKRKG